MKWGKKRAKALTNQMLCQLSYAGTIGGGNMTFHRRFVQPLRAHKRRRTDIRWNDRAKSDALRACKPSDKLKVTNCKMAAVLRGPQSH